MGPSDGSPRVVAAAVGNPAPIPSGTRPVVTGGDPFGSHRTVEPPGQLPQPAWRVDADFARIYDDELLLEVETLNVDAASFRQMEEAVVAAAVEAEPGPAGGRTAEAVRADDAFVGRGVAERVLETVASRGKQHNPVTGSGGMLLGRVRQVGLRHPDAQRLRAGDRVATLVSLSLTPLRIDGVRAVRRTSAQIDVEGEAVLFASGPYAILPSDLPERLALAALDVAGAAPQIARLARPGSTICILGAGGKSGVLCAAEARRTGGPTARVFGIESYGKYANDLRALGLCDEVFEIDARDPLAVRRAVVAANGGGEVDLTISCVSVEAAEMSAILVTKDRGICYFFSMATSFTKAALGAEGVGKDVDLVIGNGYAQGHAEHTLAMLRDFPAVRALFDTRYA